MLSTVMRVQARLSEYNTAAFAGQKLLLLMHLKVLIYIALLRVGVRATQNWADKRLLFCVSSQMIEEVTPFVKLLVASLILTQEDLSPFF